MFVCVNMLFLIFCVRLYKYVLINDYRLGNEGVLFDVLMFVFLFLYLNLGFN